MTVIVSAIVAGMLLGNTVQVGPSRTLKTVSAGYDAANAGDTIEIDAGTYANTALKVTKSNLTFKGVGGRPHISYSGNVPNGKGIFVVENPTVHDITFENLEISGGKGTSGNEAAIRFQGKNLTVRGCYLHHSFNGILEGHGDVTGSTVLVENTELAYNGNGGYEHNMYISASVAQLTVRYSYSHHVIEGHLIKSRAQTNLIYANRIVDEVWSGTGNQASAVIDLPEGGRGYIIGNMLHKGNHAGNNIAAIWYARENGNNPDKELYVVNNTYVSDTGATSTAMVLAKHATTVFVANNVVVGKSSELVRFEDTVARSVTVTHNLLDTQVTGVTTSPGAMVSNPAAVSDAKLVNRTGFDWHLAAGSAAIDAGVDPGSADAFGLTPTSQYVHTAGAETRGTVDTIDIGAFEYANAGTVIPGGEPPEPPVEPETPEEPETPTNPPPTQPGGGTTTPPPTTGGGTQQPPTGQGSSTGALGDDLSVGQSCSASGSPLWLGVLAGLTCIYRRKHAR